MKVEAINNLISGELSENEKTLWIGSPNYKKMFEKGDVFLVPFSVIWLLVALVWEFIALFGTRDGSVIDVIFPIVGFFFVLFGLYFSFGRFIHKRHVKKITFYVITNERILIIISGRESKTTSENIRNISQITKVNYANGSGTIFFDRTSYPQSFFSNTGMEFLLAYRARDSMVFYDIENVNHVYQTLMELKRNAANIKMEK